MVGKVDDSGSRIHYRLIREQPELVRCSHKCIVLSMLGSLFRRHLTGGEEAIRGLFFSVTMNQNIVAMICVSGKVKTTVCFLLLSVFLSHISLPVW